MALDEENQRISVVLRSPPKLAKGFALDIPAYRLPEA